MAKEEDVTRTGGKVRGAGKERGHRQRKPVGRRMRGRDEGTRKRRGMKTEEEKICGRQRAFWSCVPRKFCGNKGLTRPTRKDAAKSGGYRASREEGRKEQAAGTSRRRSRGRLHPV